MDPLVLLVVVTVALLVAVGGGLGLLASRGRRRLRERGPQPPVVLPRRGAAEAEDTEEEIAPAGAPDGDPGTPSIDSEVAPSPVALLERPAPAEGRMVRLRARLARSNSALGQGLLTLLARDTVDADTWDEVEETLLVADLGVEPTTQLLDRLRDRVSVLGTRDVDHVRALLREELLELVDPTLDRSLAVERVGDLPAVVLMVGVNGTGKTTTAGKLARVLVAEDKDVLLGAADTFRAAAADQLQTWGERVGVPVVRSDRDGADPAAVAFDAVKAGIEAEVDTVVIDTAGRLQNKVGLMDELGKVKRVIERQAPVTETLLVLDATTGQNGLQQAKVFAEVADVTGIVLTKLDGTAKGGIVVAVQRSLGVPVKLVGLGEGPDDLAPFDPEGFVDALLA
ncbi:MAG: signal recognition particle-docking protein FtsY [Kineosporiaceae bacterium]